MRNVDTFGELSWTKVSLIGGSSIPNRFPNSSRINSLALAIALFQNSKKLLVAISLSGLRISVNWPVSTGRVSPFSRNNTKLVTISCTSRYTKLGLPLRCSQKGYLGSKVIPLHGRPQGSGQSRGSTAVSYTHLTLPTIYSV